jgi:hypothetical protein
MGRSWRRCALRALAVALICASGEASAAAYNVTYNPYGAVEWETTLRCQSEHHDHAANTSKINALANAGYCAITFMTYSGDYRPTPYEQWVDDGRPNPDPGVPTGWGGFRRWPPEDHGAPALPLGSLQFYLPGAEELGLVGGTTGAQVHTTHMLALGLTEYIEGVGCDACGNDGGAVHNDNPFALPETHRYSSNQDYVSKVIALGAIPVLTHPTGPADQFDDLDPFPQAIEVYNNYHALKDEGSAAEVPGCTGGPSQYIAAMRATWDHMLETKSPRIWGIAVNDWASAWTPLGPASTSCWPEITLANRDRGKTQVLVASYDLETYMTAFRAGAFFAVVDGAEQKAGYPQVNDIAVTPEQIAITTADNDETVIWIGDGEQVATGSAIDLTDLPSDLVYVRAELTDPEGRAVLTQPFSLGPAAPPPPGEPVPILPREALLLLAVALLAAALGLGPRRHARG